MKNDRVYHTTTVLCSRLNEAKVRTPRTLQSFPRFFVKYHIHLTVISRHAPHPYVSLSELVLCVLCSVEHRLESSIAARAAL